MFSSNETRIPNLVTIDKTSTGQTYTNININIFELFNALNKKCEDKNLKVKKHITNQFSLDKKSIAEAELILKMNRSLFMRYGVDNIFKALVMLDDRVEDIETLILSHRRKYESMKERNLNYFDLINTLFNRVVVPSIKDIKNTEAAIIALSIERMLLDNYNKTIEIVNKSNIKLLADLIIKCNTLEMNYSMYTHEVYYNSTLNYPRELNVDQIKQIKEILNDLNYNDTMDLTDTTGLLVGKSYDYPTKNRYVVLIDIEDNDKLFIDVDEANSKKLYISMLKGVALKYRCLVGIAEDIFNFEELGNVTERKLCKQYFFEIPVEAIGLANLINNIDLVKCMSKAQIDLNNSTKEVKNLLKYVTN